jgi:hypothetical protein
VLCCAVQHFELRRGVRWCAVVCGGVRWRSGGALVLFGGVLMCSAGVLVRSAGVLKSWLL